MSSDGLKKEKSIKIGKGTELEVVQENDVELGIISPPSSQSQSQQKDDENNPPTSSPGDMLQKQPSEDLKPRDLWFYLTLIYEEIIITDDMPNLVDYLCPYDPDTVTSPWTYMWMSIIITLRGVSQVYLCAHPIAAILICIALGLSSGALLVYALIGSAVSSLSALIILKTDYDKVKNGLCGYDGVLASLAVYVFLASGKSEEEDYQPYALLPLAIALAIACGIIHETTANIMHLAHLPPFTVAFNIVTMCVLVAITRGTVAFAHWKAAGDAPAEDWSQLSVMFFVDSFFRGVGQLIFCGTTLGGGLITLGLFIGRQRDGIFAFIGALVGSITALFICRVPYSSRVAIRNGLFGYNPCAVAIVMGGGRFYQANAGAAFIAIVGSILCVLFQVAMSGFFFVDGTGLPTLTYPFFVAAWIMMMSQSQWLESLENRDENNENVAPVRKRVERMSREMSRNLLKQASQRLQGVSEAMLDVKYSASDSMHRYHDQLKRTLGGSSRPTQGDIMAAHRKKWNREVQKQQATQRREHLAANANGNGNVNKTPAPLAREPSHRDWRNR